MLLGVSIFERFTDQDALDLIREYPLAWVCHPAGGAAQSSLLPLLAETDASGRVTHLLGHMARWNVLCKAFSEDPKATILFQGPQGYVSPQYISKPQWGPTWNYAQLRIDADVVFDPEGGDAALAMLVEAMERDYPEPWRAERMGERYRGMEQAIIAFRAEVKTLNGRFKLGQDETPETLREILANHADAALVRWMKRFNEGRY